jgi:peptidoglycan hydrolase CwlO-like protein
MNYSEFQDLPRILNTIENITHKLSKIDEDILEWTFNSVQTRNKIKKIDELKKRSETLRKEIEELKKEYRILFENEDCGNKIIIYKGNL